MSPQRGAAARKRRSPHPAGARTLAARARWPRTPTEARARDRRRAMVWIHPALGALTVATFVWLGLQGLAARKRRKDAPAARARHRRYSRAVFVAMVVVAVGGSATVARLRDDLEPGRSLHFWLGWGTVLLGAALAWSGPQVPADPDARRIHPLLGAFALAGAAITAALGMGLLPD